VLLQATLSPGGSCIHAPAWSQTRQVLRQDLLRRLRVQLRAAWDSPYPSARVHDMQHDHQNASVWCRPRREPPDKKLSRPTPRLCERALLSTDCQLSGQHTFLRGDLKARALLCPVYRTGSHAVTLVPCCQFALLLNKCLRVQSSQHLFFRRDRCTTTLFTTCSARGGQKGTSNNVDIAGGIPFYNSYTASVCKDYFA
jgi:hypothetical protein